MPPTSHNIEPTAFDAAGLFNIEGRTAVVTGAAHGLGLAIATAFIGAGANVGLLDNDADALADVEDMLKGRGRAVAHTVNVRDTAAVSSAIRDIATEFGGIDIVVNDAAIFPSAPLADIDLDEVASVLDINVVGYLRTVQAALPYLQASGHGHIINFGSVTFFLGNPDGLGAYIATKGAVVGLTRALAREVSPLGVTANVLAPGAFPTRAEFGLYEDQAAFDRSVIEKQSVKRRGSVDDIAAAAIYLASDASDFVTGQTLLVDGGWTFN
ncbi:SDR family NAD(P)-dependent oxidoreductase [Streptomyces sp. NPDC005248]|uniref:SDR family NAD(P)-dependent oxidoreductase n=1 Tax=Streptomyces sp. NPDC005248 TaxID=3364709 RepID=UPI0036C874AD